MSDDYPMQDDAQHADPNTGAGLAQLQEEVNNENANIANNPFEEDAIEAKPKRPTGTRTFTDADLIEKPTGLNALYTSLVLEKD
jgi:hypothetical protein